MRGCASAEADAWPKAIQPRIHSPGAVGFTLAFGSSTPTVPFRLAPAFYWQPKDGDGLPAPLPAARKAKLMNNNHSSIPLIPRSVLFGNPERAAAQISPDGAHLAWLGPVDGVLNVWVAPRDDLTAARVVTRDGGRGIRFFRWSYAEGCLLYLQDKGGDENWRLHAVDVHTGTERDLTPFDAAQAQIVAVSPKFPGEIVVGLNHRDPQWHDIYRLDLATGALQLMLQHDRFAAVEVDDDYRLRLATAMTPDGGLDVFIPSGDGSASSGNGSTPSSTGWQPWDRIPAEDALTTNVVGFDKSGQRIYQEDSRGRDTAALLEIDMETRASRVLAADERADSADVLRHPTERHVQAVSFVYDRKRWQVLDPALQADLDYLATVVDGEVEIVSRSLDDRWWVVLYLVDDGPARSYLYDRERREARFLFSARPALDGLPLVKMHSAVIKARDGLDLVAYLSLPPGSDPDGGGHPDRALPMVLIPHGGPWARDTWGFNPQHQWLANRGYAVLSVNFRASVGFGKAFANAGDLEWGGAILADQQDAVAWAIAGGIADPDRVAIMGGSFGGYSTLAGLTFTPELFACGVDIVGPSNLITLLESIPPYWKPMLEIFTTRVGDHRTEEGRALLAAHSPLTHVDRIRRPLLIGQGANDPRVKQAESDQIVAAMQAKAIPVTYVLYPDEGHGFARPENRIAFNAIAEAFLAHCLGGRCEAIGADFRGSSLTVPAGAEVLPGLEAAMAGAPDWSYDRDRFAGELSLSQIAS
jgi:dipeptidyl aminopeptidase/acylaminoacyl peptidase